MKYMEAEGTLSEWFMIVGLDAGVQKQAPALKSAP